jgi:hypothetical protein
MAIDNERARLIGLAKVHRWLLGLFLVYFVLIIAWRSIDPAHVAYTPVMVATFAAWILMLVMVAEVARRVWNVWWMIPVIVLMLIPFVNLVTLLAVGHRAARTLQDAGFTVRLMGVPKDQLRSA